MARPTYDPELLLVGTIGRPHGLKGQMTLRAYNVRGAPLLAGSELIFDHEGTRMARRLRSASRQKDGWLVRVDGVDSREGAAALTHAEIRVHKKALPPLAPGEFFVEDLLGCEVRTQQARLLGRVDSIFWNGAQDVMSIVSAGGAAGRDEYLIPVIPQFVHAVDLPQRQVMVAWDPEDAEEVPRSGSLDGSHFGSEVPGDE